MLFQLRRPLPRFPGIQSVIFTGSQLVALKRAGLLVMRWRCRLGGGHIVTADAWSDHHWQPQTCTVGSQGEVCHRLLVDVFLWQLFPDGLQGDFLLIGRLRLRLEFMLLFQHGVPDVIVQWFKSEELEGHSVFSMNLFAFSQLAFCLSLEHLEMRVVLVKTA